MKIGTVHRITGVHPLLNGTGAAIWLSDLKTSDLLRTQSALQRGLSALGWNSLVRRYVRYDETVLVVDAPTDQLYTACELLEWATGVDPNELEFQSVLAFQQKERVPHWQAVKGWALANGLPVFDCEDEITLGMGRWSHTFPVREIPSIEVLKNNDIRAIPSVYITGTNGKTTTARMLAQMARAAGYCDGLTSSDGVMIRGEWKERGDWTGAGAARMVLRDQTVDFAVLETARGGLMRRGLVLDTVDTAIVTNVSDDHLGAWGIRNSDDMAEVKLAVGFGVKLGGSLILNAESTVLRQAYQRLQFRLKGRRLLWFSSRQRTNMDAWFARDRLWLQVNDEPQAVVHVNEVPMLMGGAAMHNVENALAAICAGHQLGLSVDSMAAGLRHMRPNATHSRGRSNIFKIGGATVLVDFAHNPDGMRRVFELVSAFPAQRKMLMFGQASDRSLPLLEELAYQAASLNADRYYLKELPSYSYGVSARHVPEILKAGLMHKGISLEHIELGGTEVEITQKVLSDVRDGDLLVLLSHAHIDAVVDLVQEAVDLFERLAVQ